MARKNILQCHTYLLGLEQFVRFGQEVHLSMPDRFVRFRAVCEVWPGSPYSNTIYICEV
jgi:hypothetical protein